MLKWRLLEFQKIVKKISSTHGFKNKYCSYLNFPQFSVFFSSFLKASTFLGLLLLVVEKPFGLSAQISNPKLSLPWGCNLSTCKWGQLQARVKRFFSFILFDNIPRITTAKRGNVKLRWTPGLRSALQILLGTGEGNLERRCDSSALSKKGKW